MEIVDISFSLKKLLVEMYEKKVLSANTQTVFSKFSFYIALSDLKKFGLVEPNGNFKGGEIKEWKLTPKGERLVKAIIEMSNILKSNQYSKK